MPSKQAKSTYLLINQLLRHGSDQPTLCQLRLAYRCPNDKLSVVAAKMASRVSCLLGLRVRARCGTPVSAYRCCCCCLLLLLAAAASESAAVLAAVHRQAAPPRPAGRQRLQSTRSSLFMAEAPWWWGNTACCR